MSATIDDYEFTEPRYAIAYLLKGQTDWRLSMNHELSYLNTQEKVLWENPSVVATKMIAYCQATRLLNAEELKVANGNA